jgi:hypothetical protein
MANVQTTMAMDTSGLSRAIPLAVANGRRTVEEQAVTSLGWIFYNAQKATGKVEISEIDSELSATSTPVLSTRGKRKGLPLKSGRRNITTTARTGAEMVVVARMHAAGISKTTGKANYNQLTGSRWALPMIPKGTGTAGFWSQVAKMAQRMIKGRHSSTAFLKSGFTFAIRTCFSNPLFQHSRKYRSTSSALSEIRSINIQNKRDVAKLGGFDISGVGSNSMMVTGENNVGESSGNTVMDEKRRQALIIKAGPHLQQAIDNESVKLSGWGSELGQRMTDNLREVQEILG